MRPAEHMVLTRDAPFGAQQAAKHVKLKAAKAPAGCCCGTDRAVVLDQQKSLTGTPLKPRHIPFRRAQLGQGLELPFHRPLSGEPPPIRCRDVVAPTLQQARKDRLAEFPADAADQVDRELRMRVGEQAGRAGRERPEASRPTATVGTVGEADESFRKKTLEALPDSLDGDPEPPSECLRLRFAQAFQLEQDRVGCGLHAVPPVHQLNNL